jgi:hypothetical protein
LLGEVVQFFLGGKDEIENTELCDLDVDVPLQRQLFMAM